MPLFMFFIHDPSLAYHFSSRMTPLWYSFVILSTFIFHRRILHSSVQWRHNGHDSVSNQQSYNCLLNRLFRRRSKKTSKLRVNGLCALVNSPHKWPVMRKMFPFDDVILFHIIYSGSTVHVYLYSQGCHTGIVLIIWLMRCWWLWSHFNKNIKMMYFKLTICRCCVYWSIRKA